MTPRKPTPADVPRHVTDAREHLVDLRRAVNQITDDDLYDDGRGSETPDRTPKRVTSPALWEPRKHGLQTDWQRAWRHVADACFVLTDGTDVVSGSATALIGAAVIHDHPSRRSVHELPTVPHADAHRMVAGLECMLAELDSPNLPPPEADAVLRCCDEIRAARETLAGHLDREPPGEDPPECSNEGCSNDAERRDDGRYKPECSACTKYRQRNGRPREVAA